MTTGALKTGGTMSDSTPPTSPLAKAYSWLCRAEVTIAAVLLVFIVVLIFSGGVARMMRHPINWTIDFATCFFAWATFLAADIAWRNNSLMGVDLLSARLGPVARLWLLRATYLIIALFLVYLAYAGVRLAILSSARSFQGISWISYSWVTMSLPVGAGLLLVTTCLKFRGTLGPNAPESAAPQSGREGASDPC